MQALATIMGHISFKRILYSKIITMYNHRPYWMLTQWLLPLLRQHIFPKNPGPLRLMAPWSLWSPLVHQRFHFHVYGSIQNCAISKTPTFYIFRYIESIYIYGYIYIPRKSKEQTLPLGSRESFALIILKTILCLVDWTSRVYIYILVFVGRHFSSDFRPGFRSSPTSA